MPVKMAVGFEAYTTFWESPSPEIVTCNFLLSLRFQLYYHTSDF